MEEGKLAKWHVKEGDAVKAGDILAEIETDKATMEFESIDEGRIGKILVPEGAEGVKVNAPIAVLLGEGETAGPDIPQAMAAIRDAIKPVKDVPKPDASAAAKPAAAPVVASAVSADKTNGARLFASPLAKRIAATRGVDLSVLRGSGPRGRIVKADVENAVPGAAVPAQGKEAAKTVPAPKAEASLGGITPLPDARLFYAQGDYEEVPHDSMRKTIARRLTSAKTLIPHYYLTIDCDIGALMEVRGSVSMDVPLKALAPISFRSTISLVEGRSWCVDKAS